MLLLDANAILRYTLNDNTDMAISVRNLIENSKVYIRYEVLAEVVYVLNKVYLMPRKEIADGVKAFISGTNVETESNEVISHALKTFAEVNLDFVDCVLYSFKAIYGYDVFTFDRKLNSMIAKLHSL